MSEETIEEKLTRLDGLLVAAQTERRKHPGALALFSEREFANELMQEYPALAARIRELEDAAAVSDIDTIRHNLDEMSGIEAAARVKALEAENRRLRESGANLHDAIIRDLRYGNGDDEDKAWEVTYALQKALNEWGAALTPPAQEKKEGEK